MAGDLTIASTLRDRTATSIEAYATERVAIATAANQPETKSNDAVTTTMAATLTPAALEASQPVPRLSLRRWSAAVVVSDALAAALAAGAVVVARLGLPVGTAHGLPLLGAPAVAAWLIVITLAGGYETRQIPAGFDYYRRAVTAGGWVVAAAAFVSFALHADVSRVLVLGSAPAATVLTIAGRYLIRKALHRSLRGGRATHRVLAIGLPHDVWQLVAHMRRSSFAGFRVVGAITPDESGETCLPTGVGSAGSDVRNAIAQARLLQVDTIAVVATQLLGPGQLRKLSWDLEGTDIDLVLAPAITDVAGPRISTHPVAGLPLLCVEKPRFSGPRRIVKDALDRVLAGAALVVLAPLFIAIALGVRLTSRGSVLYRQERVGLNGTTFRLVKFRSMRSGAHHELGRLWAANEHDGPLFKIRSDPRLTAIGAFLRRWSLDELPQLWNVVVGDMSLVGPRPPLPSEVERYGVDVRRRLLVKPGMTGLWQVSGRAELSWEESVRLDLYYVDNWSVGLDLVLLWKTIACVARGQGAF